jgi:hypothetical protein
MESSSNQNTIPQIPQIDVYQRLAFLERIIDGLEPASSLSFNDLYERWQRAQFFKQLAELGFLQVSYNNNEIIDFEPSESFGNRHQALALSCFLSSVYANSCAVVSSPHECGNIFTATFTRVSSSCIEYVNDYGSRVRFTFDSSRPSQFI